MIDLGPHAAFIVAAYLGVLVVVVGLVAAVLVVGRIRAKKLAALELERDRDGSA